MARIDDKRSAILAATLDLIAERGFHGTPMSQVAKRSGVSTGIIYHYFEGKDDLIHALYRQVKLAYSEALVAGQVITLPFPDHLERLWLNAFRFYVTHPQETVFLEQYENSPYGHKLSEVMLLDDNMRALAALIEADLQAGLVHVMPLEVLFELTLGVASGLARRQIGGAITLNDETLAWVAAACARSVTA